MTEGHCGATFFHRESEIAQTYLKATSVKNKRHDPQGL